MMGKQVRLPPWRQALRALSLLAPLLLALLLAPSPATAQQASDCKQVGRLLLATHFKTWHAASHLSLLSSLRMTVHAIPTL